MRRRRHQSIPKERFELLAADLLVRVGVSKDFQELQTPKTLAGAPADILVVASPDDSVTSAALSRQSVAGVPHTWLDVPGEHLHLWQDPAYRQAVLDFF